ncbi:hypothetical protein BDV19DRAFT_367961 [Aspergillus venezuelensis]
MSVQPRYASVSPAPEFLSKSLRLLLYAKCTAGYFRQKEYGAWPALIQLTSICMHIFCFAACLPGEIEHLEIMTGRASTSEFGMVLLAWILLALDHEYGSYHHDPYPYVDMVFSQRVHRGHMVTIQFMNLKVC